jgi:hypothetical protein
MADDERRLPHDKKRLKTPPGVDFEDLVADLLLVDPDELPEIKKGRNKD